MRRTLLVTTCFLIVYPAVVLSWPDGAPCVHAAFESMNPLEAVEHQGGLQLTEPPYEIEVDQKCYWRNQPVGLTLQGRNDSVWFKGFVIQPFKWNNDQLGNRIGQLVRLDDNGSWQQQCFRYKDSATHSHNEKKKKMKMWWKVDDESDTVQFVATVVKHQTSFWVKSVRSRPIPPCRLNRDGIEGYHAPAPTVPPAVKNFKIDTEREFGIQSPSSSQQQQTVNRPLPVATTSSPISVSDGFNQRVANVGSTQSQVAQVRKRLRGQFRNNNLATRRRLINNGNTQQFTQAPQAPAVCIDRDPQNRCGTWVAYCRAPTHVRYLSSFCARTCGYCR